MTPEEKEELQRLIKIKRRLQELKEEQSASKVKLRDVHKKIAEHLKKTNNRLKNK